METRKVITINENGTVSLPNDKNIMMRDFEIAELLGLSYQSTKTKIKALLNIGIGLDYPHGGEIVGTKIIPEFYGMELIISLAFSVNTYKAEILRKWVLNSISNSNNANIPIFISLNNPSRNKNGIYN